MIRLTLESLLLQTPTWSDATLKPGKEVTLAVVAPDLTAEQTIRFDIYRVAEWIDSISAPAGKPSVKWTPPNLPGVSTLLFHARLIEKPTPANGQCEMAATILSPTATLTGYALTMTTIDAAFVPKQEKLEVTYTLTDAGLNAKKARMEVWGERYPGTVAAPLYTEDFTPTDGPLEWKSWAGKANAGHLSGKFITPEFSPYTLRIIVGPDAAAVKDPHGVGQGLVAIAETQFEIIVESVHIRLQKKLKLQTKVDDYKLDEVLGIEPRLPDGTFTETERLPKPTEVGRIRIPMARHHARGEPMDQGGPDIGDGYLGGASGKFVADRQHYTRPELPIEFEPRLRSRVAATNTDADKRGLFEQDAIGPMQIEPVAEDYYDDAGLGGIGPTAHQLYLVNSAMKLKRGTHSAPYFDPATNLPEFQNWQARLEVAADNDQDFDITTYVGTKKCGYTITAAHANDELKVYLNRSLLDLSLRADDNELDDGTKAYRQVAAGGGAGKDIAIRLAPNLTKAGDILWIVRTDATSAEAADWKKFPPGPNCPLFYGGFRGLEPTADLNNYFRANYSPDPAGAFEPIIGKAKGTYAYTDYIKMRPEANLPVVSQERVEISARTGGSRRGIAGAIFSPSWLSGDMYVLHAKLDQEPYQRRFGFIQRYTRPIDSKTGTLEVWRHLQFVNSLRQPAAGHGGAGFAADAGAPYHGDGTNMDFGNLNTQNEDAFYEWTISDKAPVHKGINLKKYRKAHGLYSTGHAGKVALDSNAAVSDQFVQYDFYREMLPAGIPGNRVNVATNAVRAQAKGTASPTVGAAVVQAINNHALVPDAALAGGGAAIPVWGGSANDYFFQAFARWKDTIAYNIVDALTPRTATPKKMNIVRWAKLHEDPFWNDATGLAVGNAGIVWEGESMGDGNSMIHAGTVSNTLFAHEMGHATHLVHMVAGNFGWKHHNINEPNCYMSYTHTAGTIFQPGGAVGTMNTTVAMPGKPYPISLGGTSVEKGWPHWETNPNTGNLEFCIHFGPGIALGAMCAKCALKLRGWNDELIPVAWRHPDLY